MRKKRTSTVQLESGAVVSVSDLVGYYLEGWRYGYLEEVNGATVKVRPIGGAGTTQRLVTVMVEDLKAVCGKD